MSNRLRGALDKAYNDQRGLDSGLDPALTGRDISGLVVGKVVERLRGYRRGLPGAYVQPRVTIRGRSRLVMGSRVSLGGGVLIDARSHAGITLGNSVTIDRFAVLRASGTVRQLGQGIVVGDRTAIGFANLLHGGGGIHVGSDCLLGPHVVLMSEEHGIENGSAIREQVGVPAPISIGSDVWIGAGATVLGGVTIGDGVVIGAGSVVTKDLPSGVVAFGVPARVARQR